jgi:hypothetical protein
MKTKEVCKVLGLSDARVYQLGSQGVLVKTATGWDPVSVEALRLRRESDPPRPGRGGRPKGRVRSTRSKKAGKKVIGGAGGDSRFARMETGELVEWIVSAQSEAKRRSVLLAKVSR